MFKLVEASQVLIELFSDFHIFKDLKAKTAAGLTRQSATVFEFGLPEPMKTLGRPSRRLKQLFLLGSFLRRLKRSVGASSELVLELLDPTCGVNKLQLAGVERVANIANVHFQFLAGAAGDKAVPATARYRDLLVIRMNAIFHGFTTTFLTAPKRGSQFNAGKVSDEFVSSGLQYASSRRNFKDLKMGEEGLEPPTSTL